MNTLTINSSLTEQVTGLLTECEFDYTANEIIAHTILTFKDSYAAMWAKSLIIDHFGTSAIVG